MGNTCINQVRSLDTNRKAGWVENKDIYEQLGGILGGSASVVAGSFVRYVDRDPVTYPISTQVYEPASSTDTMPLFVLPVEGASTTFTVGSNLRLIKGPIDHAVVTYGATVTAGGYLMLNSDGSKLIPWTTGHAKIAIAMSSGISNGLGSVRIIEPQVA